MQIFSSTQCSLLRLAKWLRGLLTNPFTVHTTSHSLTLTALFPPPPLLLSKEPSLPSTVLSSHESQQLNGDIRRKVEEPKPSGSSPLGRLVTALRIATVSPDLPSPPLPCQSILSAAVLSSSPLPRNRKRIFKSSVSLTARERWLRNGFTINRKYKTCVN